MFAARKLFGVGYVSFYLLYKRNMFWNYIDGFKVHWQKPFTVKNSPWKKRNISLGPCLEKMTAR